MSLNYKKNNEIRGTKLLINVIAETVGRISFKIATHRERERERAEPPTKRRGTSHR